MPSGQVQKTCSGDIEEPALLQCTGVGRKVHPAENGNFPNGFSRAEDVKDLFLAVRRYLENLHAAGHHQVETVCRFTLGEKKVIFQIPLLAGDFQKRAAFPFGNSFEKSG